MTAMMANRSDRRFPNPLRLKANIEAVEMMRRKRADFHQGPGQHVLHQEAGYMSATGHRYQRAPCAWGWVHT